MTIIGMPKLHSTGANGEVVDGSACRGSLHRTRSGVDKAVDLLKAY
jgi:hypothetical protein